MWMKVGDLRKALEVAPDDLEIVVSIQDESGAMTGELRSAHEFIDHDDADKRYLVLIASLDSKRPMLWIGAG